MIVLTVTVVCNKEALSAVVSVPKPSVQQTTCAISETAFETATLSTPGVIAPGC